MNLACGILEGHSSLFFGLRFSGAVAYGKGCIRRPVWGQPVIKNPHIEGGMILIWYFLAGMIAGAVGWHRFVGWIGPIIEQQRKIEELRSKDDGSRV